MPTKTALTPEERAKRDVAEAASNGSARGIAEGAEKPRRNRGTNHFVGQAGFDPDDRGTPNFIGSR